MTTTAEAGSRVTPDMRAELSAEQVGHLRHPVARDDIMYSAYVQSMALLFHHRGVAE